jgi:hypothetical protein
VAVDLALTATTFDSHEPAKIGLRATPRARLATGSTKGNPAAPPCAVSTAHRGGEPVGYVAYSQPRAVRHCAARCGAEPPDGSHGARVLSGYSAGTQRCARTVMFVRVEPTTLTLLLACKTRTSPPVPLVLSAACTPQAAKAPKARVEVQTRGPAVLRALDYPMPRRLAGRVLRLLAAHAVRTARGAQPARCIITARERARERYGAAKREPRCAGTQRVLRGAHHRHRYVSEGRVDDADVAGAAALAVDINEPAATKLTSGLHATRRSGFHQR